MTIGKKTYSRKMFPVSFLKYVRLDNVFGRIIIINKCGDLRENSAYTFLFQENKTKK